MIAKTLFHEKPLMPNRFAPLPYCALRPEGWLREQLCLARDGMATQLEALHPALGDESAWFGGTLDGNDAPAYLRALAAFAYLLSDEALLQTLTRRIAYVLSHQREDGSFGPAQATFQSRGDFLQALWQHYSATADRDAVRFMMRYFRYLSETLSTTPLSPSEEAHTGDTLDIALKLYTLTQKPALLDVCRKITQNQVDWTGYFHTFNYRQPMAKHTPPHTLREGLERRGEEQSYFSHLEQMTHAANLAQGLRVPPLCYALSGSSKHAGAFEVGFSRLMKYHGTANGAFTGDPLLAGMHPSQGTDAAAIAQLIESLQTALSMQGTPDCADALDRVAYNALLSLYSPDMRTCQRITQTNQVCIDKSKRNFYAADEDVTLFGTHHDLDALVPLQRALPVFAGGQWMLSRDGGLALMGFAPMTLRYRLGNSALRIQTHGAYPFDGAIRVSLSLSAPCAFPLHIRIPQWAEGATVAIDADVLPAQPGTFCVINREWHDGDEVLINLPMSVRQSRWYHDSVAVERGALVFGLKLDEQWACDEGDVHAHAWTVTTRDAWNVALAQDSAFDVHATPQTAAPFGQGNPVTLTGDGVLLPDWTMRMGSADQPPIAAAHVGDTVRITLVPYAACALRIAQFPLVKKP